MAYESSYFDLPVSFPHPSPIQSSFPIPSAPLRSTTRWEPEWGTQQQQKEITCFRAIMRIGQNFEIFDLGNHAVDGRNPAPIGG